MAGNRKAGPCGWLLDQSDRAKDTRVFGSSLLSFQESRTSSTVGSDARKCGSAEVTAIRDRVWKERKPVSLGMLSKQQLTRVQQISSKLHNVSLISGREKARCFDKLLGKISALRPRVAFDSGKFTVTH